MTRSDRIVVGVAGIALGLFLVIELAHNGLGITLNISRSMREGLYREAPMPLLRQGSIVEVCLTGDIAKEALARHYLSRGAACSDHLAPVIKRLIATPNDRVAIQNGYIIVTSSNGSVTDYYAPIQHTSFMGTAIKRFIHDGEQAPGYWLYGDNNVERSWDSRYYGPVQRAQITLSLIPLWVRR